MAAGVKRRSEKEKEAIGLFLKGFSLLEIREAMDAKLPPDEVDALLATVAKYFSELSSLNTSAMRGWLLESLRELFKLSAGPGATNDLDRALAILKTFKQVIDSPETKEKPAGKGKDEEKEPGAWLSTLQTRT